MAPRPVKLGIVHVVPGLSPRASGIFGGDTFNLYLATFNEPGNVGPNTRPTEVGNTFSTHSLWGIPSTFGSAIIDGNSYPKLSYGGTVEFNGPQFPLIQEMLTYGIHCDVAFTATLKGYLRDAFVPDPPDPTVTIELTGTATLYVTFAPNTPGSSLYNPTAIEYCLH